jgi:hypothetical protein
MPEQKPKPRGGIHLHVDDTVAPGMYSNIAMINHNENEFVLDFAFAAPGAPTAKVRARIIVTPRHAKRLLGALEQNVLRYQERFGAIDITVREGEITTN